MAITTYTSYDEVRAVLGVSATELADTVLSLTQYDTMLFMELEETNAGLTALYTTISALSPGSRTADQQWFYDLTRLFSAYAIARNLLASLPLFSVKKLTDGRAEFERQKDVYADVRDAVNGLYDRLRLKLSSIFVTLTPGATLYTATVQTFTASTGLALDPVTNA